MIRVAFYTRISLDEEKQKYSLGAQKERLEAYCKGQYGDDWTLYKIYRDTATGTTLDRPELQRMLLDAKAGAFDILAILRTDRLSRRVAHLSNLATDLKSYDVDLKSATEPIDTSTPAGMLVFQILGASGEFEQKSIVERTTIGMLKKAQTGLWPGGVVPLGLSNNPETGLQIDEKESVIIKKIFDLYTQGKEGSSAIAQKLNAAGYRTKRGKKFSRKAILDIIRSPFYVGKFVWQKKVFDGTHESIVSQAIFDEAQQILNRRSAQSPGFNWHNQNQRLLSGIIRCSRCNSAMIGVSGNKKGKKTSYYACRKRLNTQDCDQDYVRADLIEDQILGEVQDVFRDEALLEEIWQSAQKKLAENAPSIDAELQSLDKQRTKTQAALDKYFQAFEEGTMEPAACNKRVENLSTQLQQLEDRRIALEERRDGLDLPEIKIDFLNEILSNLKGVVEAVPNAQKKHLLRLLVEKVLVKDRCTFEVWYRLPHFHGVRTLSLLVAPRGLEPLLPP